MNDATPGASATAADPAGTRLHCRLRGLRHIALDLDGTVYRGRTLFPTTLPFLRTLSRLGIGHTFVTNNSSRSLASYVAKLEAMGIPATRENVFISTHAALEFLRLEWPGTRRLFVLGVPEMTAELAAAGYTIVPDSSDAEPDAVVVAFDVTMTYARLCRAAWWISRGKPFLATNPDQVCPTDEPTVLVDCGSICAALREATGRSPDVIVGKPHALMLRGVLSRHGLEPQALAMVGDRIMTDVAMARIAGAFGVLVLSGEATLADAQHANPAPDLIVQDIGEFGELLRAARRSEVSAG